MVAGLVARCSFSPDGRRVLTKTRIPDFSSPLPHITLSRVGLRCREYDFR